MLLVAEPSEIFSLFYKGVPCPGPGSFSTSRDQQVVNGFGFQLSSLSAKEEVGVVLHCFSLPLSN